MTNKRDNLINSIKAEFSYGFVVIICLIVQACGSDNQQILGSSSAPTTLQVANTATMSPTFSLTSPITAVYSATSNTLSSPTTAKTASPLTNGYQYRWLQGIPCSAPCWEGITPGKTSAQDALNLLNHNPLVATAKINEPYSEKSDITSVGWDWVAGDKSPTDYIVAGGSLDFHSTFTSQIIYQITPYYNTYYKLSDIIKKYGEPSNIRVDYRVLEHGPIYNIQVLFISDGISVSNSWDKKPTINGDLTFNMLSFFEPNIQGFRNILQDATQENQLTRWKGFNTFNFYCRDLPGKYDKCIDA